MTRGFLINHLIEQDCYPDNECDSTVSQLWHNAINGEICYVPFEDEILLMTYCHIICELKIDAPAGYDSDYDVYVGFRTRVANQVIENRGEEGAK